MRRLAGGLEQLETLERHLARLRDVRERVRRFHQRTYSAYARAAVRERADALRQAQTAVENAAEKLRTTEAELERERQQAERAAAARDEAEAEVGTSKRRTARARQALPRGRRWPRSKRCAGTQ